MERIDKKKIEKIIAGFRCPKKFKCCKSRLDDLCKAKDVGSEHFLECLEKDSAKCAFALHFGYGVYCSCPLRIYIGKKLKK